MSALTRPGARGAPRPRLRSVLAAAACLGAVVAMGAPARAADTGDDAAATELFNAGRDLMRSGDFAAACPKLAESARLHPTVGALAKLAECDEHEHRLVGAYAHWKQALNLARTAGDERIPDVERELARVDAQVPKLRIVAATALPPAAVIRVDAMELGPAGLGVPLAVEPGRHVVQVAASGKAPWSATVDARADGATHDVTIPALADGPLTAPLSPADAASAPTGAGAGEAIAPVAGSGSRTGRTVGLVVAGVGLAALASGAAFGVDALHRRDEAGCRGTVCPDDASAGALRTAQTSATWSTVLFAAGGALLGGGVAVWWLSLDKGGARRGLLVTPGGVAGTF
jgi:hypothetical protein